MYLVLVCACVCVCVCTYIIQDAHLLIFPIVFSTLCARACVYICVCVYIYYTSVDMLHNCTYILQCAYMTQESHPLILYYDYTQDMPKRDGATALHIAAEKGHAAIGELLINFGAEVNKV